MDEVRNIVRMLRGAGVAVLAFTGLLAGWLLYQAVLHPDTQARQFGKYGEAVPLWLPLIAFVILGLLGVAFVFFRAARRVRSGEDLYGSRFRRRPGASHAP